MKQRHLARRVALQSLFEIDLAHHLPGVVLTERLADQEEPLEADATAFAHRLVSGVIVEASSHRSPCDMRAPSEPIDPQSAA